MRIFVSHISEEVLEARNLKGSIEKALPGTEVFVSASDIHLGEPWLRQIEEALQNAQIILALCSPASVRRPWLNFETGSGWMRKLPVLPVCYKGMNKRQLPDPLSVFQSIELYDARSCIQLIEELARLSRLVPNQFDPDEMLASVQAKLPTRTSTIGIVLSGGQATWPRSDRSIFTRASLPGALPQELMIRDLTDEQVFLSVDLHSLSGIILASPRDSRLLPETIAALVDWVMLGGRLLLLGFELGDRHHAANLADISRHFGIHPSCDIVGPPKYGQNKPYGITVVFDPAEAHGHSFTSGLPEIELANAQTLRVEPGGTEWLRVGRNSVYSPARDLVVYDEEGKLTTPGRVAYEENSSASWLAVAVQAPQGLCGKGQVHMIGTWDLLGRSTAFGENNTILVSRLFDWLSASGKSATELPGEPAIHAS